MSRTRRSGTGAGRPIRSIGSESSCSPATERLDERAYERMLLGLRRGDPHDELLGAWLAKESVRDVYLTPEKVGEARGFFFRKAIVGCQERRGRREVRSLGDTLERWQNEILNHHRTGASNDGSDRGSQPVREEDRPRRSWLRLFRPLPPARVLLHAGGVTVAQASVTTPDQNPCSLLQRVEPDNPDRLHSEGAWAHLCGAAPVPAGSGRTSGKVKSHDGGDRQANSALWRIVMVRIAHDPETQLYFERRVKEGKTKPEVSRILKRYVAREVYRYLPRGRVLGLLGLAFPRTVDSSGLARQRHADPQLGPTILKTRDL